MSNTEKRLQALELKAKEQEATLGRLQKQIEWQGKLLNESLNLTETTSSIMVEAVTTLDNRMDEVADVFVEKIEGKLNKE